MKIRVAITGATGMVGEGVLSECLANPSVEKVMIINRRPAGITHGMLTEVIVPDFFQLSSAAQQLAGYDACFFCLGVSSVGMSEAEYTRLTHDLTLKFAHMFLTANPNAVFCYVSGAGTDSSEKGRSMWARVKGKTENELLRLRFKSVFLFRPGLIAPGKGMKNTLGLYKYLGWLIPAIRLIAPEAVCDLRDIGRAMINATINGYERPVLESRDIRTLARS